MTKSYVRKRIRLHVVGQGEHVDENTSDGG